MDGYTAFSCGGDDCDDSNPSVWAYTYDQRPITDVWHSISPSLVWTGTDLGLAWADSRDMGDGLEIYFARVSTSLTKVGGDVRITTDAQQSDQPSLVWTGSEYALAWSDWRSLIARDIYFTRLDSVGRRITGDTRLTEALHSTSSYEPSLVWTGSEFGVAFTNGENGDIYFARLTAGGDEIGSEVSIDTDPVAQGCCSRMVWTGIEYGLVWNASVSGDQEVRFCRLTSAGSPIGSITVLESLAEMPDSTSPNLIWDGSNLSLVWTGNATDNDEIYLTRIDESGVEIGVEIQLTNTADRSRYPAIVWNGNEYGLFWQEISSTSQLDYFTRFGRDGRRLSPDIPFSFSQYHDDRLSLIWTGHEYILAWSDYRGMDRDIYLGRIGCGW